MEIRNHLCHSLNVIFWFLLLKKIIMNWFKGSIPESINLSRERKCIFVVVVTDESSDSLKLLDVIENDEQVLKLFSNFVAISLKNGSNEAKQFSQLCKIILYAYLNNKQLNFKFMIYSLIFQILLSSFHQSILLVNKVVISK